MLELPSALYLLNIPGGAEGGGNIGRSDEPPRLLQEARQAVIATEIQIWSFMIEETVM
jgi:hypothetical protein